MHTRAASVSGNEPCFFEKKKMMKTGKREKESIGLNGGRVCNVEKISYTFRLCVYTRRKTNAILY